MMCDKVHHLEQMIQTQSSECPAPVASAVPTQSPYEPHCSRCYTEWACAATSTTPTGTAMVVEEVKNFKLGQVGAAMTQRGADTVRTGVAAANDNDIFAQSRNRRAIDAMFGVTVAAVIQQALGVSTQEVHRQVNALEVAPFNRQVAPFGGAATVDNGVKFAL